MTNIDIRLIRQKLGISQEELGKMIGVSRNTIANYEKGGVIPESKHDLLLKLMNSDTAKFIQTYLIDGVDLSNEAGMTKTEITTALADATIVEYRKLLKEKDNEIGRLNKEIGRLETLLEKYDIEYKKAK